MQLRLLGSWVLVGRHPEARFEGIYCPAGEVEGWPVFVRLSSQQCSGIRGSLLALYWLRVSYSLWAQTDPLAHC